LKLFLYIIFGFIVHILALLVITRGQAPEGHPAMMFAIVVLFAIPPLGGFWMAYMAIRYEKNPFPMLLLALCIPYTFVWYYREKVRTGKLKRKHIAA
jgi:hypothetical protein